MELFFTETQYIVNKTARFDTFESRHIIKTLRKSVGDKIDFTDGKGNIYHGLISQTHPELLVEINQISEIPRPVPQVTLGIGFIKQTRMDFIFEKGTELGVSNFYIFAGKNSKYYSENISRWQKITRQAIKQSLQCHLPGIKCFKDFTSILYETKNISYKLIAHQDAGEPISLTLNKRHTEKFEDTIILIGPEGGFTKNEIELAHENNFRSISFGKYRLRSETAAIAAIANVNLFRNQTN